VKISLYADVLLPLAVKGRFTYRVPDLISDKLAKGSRVVVNFGSTKLYSGVVAELHSNRPDTDKIKDIIELLDEEPVINKLQLKFWEWLGAYYMCTEGEVLKAALPSGLSLESETVIRINPLFAKISSLDADENYLFSLIGNKEQIYLKSLPGEISGRRTIRILNSLILAGAITAGQKIEEKYNPKEENFLILSRKFTDTELNEMLDRLSRAPKQHDLLSSYLRLTGYTTGKDLFPVKRTVLLKDTGASHSALNTVVRKGIFTMLSLETSRLEKHGSGNEVPRTLSPAQSAALNSVKNQLGSKDIILLHGITSSGKTEIYIHLIAEQLKMGKQVLYLLPEIALTTQIIERLKKHFGQVTGVYHSRLSDNEKTETWKKVTDRQNGYKLILGARSALFLPYYDLGLVIVDEEHDGSYKQHDPDPRYHARDSAIMLASYAGAKTILGSATPSVESYHNAVVGKYGLVNLNERYGKINLPEIVLANAREAARKKLMVSHFTPQLLYAMDAALQHGEQVILFRNRRGFSPYIECSECGWIPNCKQCAVNLTWHKEINRLVCHYCGSSEPIPVKCGNCCSLSMTAVGFGTEKIEDEIKIIFPGARVDRMDQDTTRKKNAYTRIISAFEKGETDILIGTQMISKGLDFENLTVVGILNAESMLNFPDFRAHERAFQMMSQVSGRAGRRQKHGKVIIQTTDPDGRIIRQVVNHDYTGMYESQMEERKIFNYPPFSRLIKITIRHKERTLLNEFSALLGDDLRKSLGNRVLGPEFPVISRIQLWYIKNILVKIEREKPVARAKELITGSIERIGKIKGAGSLKIDIDVDPY
jgi:primosomal protein N' (replication factor Y) (superfamily II helicase)